MQVVVLAGGMGSRLRPWTNDVPKPLLPMLDATLLERVVEGVPSDLVDEVIVAGGYKVDLIRDYFAKADVDLKFGIPPEGLMPTPTSNTQEVSAENILDEKNDND